MPSEIDHGMFVLSVDLWNHEQSRQVNLVKNTQSSPSISSTALAAYTDVAQAGTAYTNNTNAMNAEPPTPHFKFEPGPNHGSPFQAPTQTSYSPYPGPPQGTSYPPSPAQQPYGEVAYQQGFPHPQMVNAPGFHQNGYQGQVPLYYTTGAGIHAQIQGVQPGLDYGMVSQPLMGPPPGLNPYDGLPYQVNDQEPQRSSSNPSGMFTRNLIGSLAASAFRLTDPDDKIGIWFVLQDLSVRTEGNFRYGLPDYNYSKSLTVPQPPLLVCERRRYRRAQRPAHRP
jgi:hypothetical protein